MSFSATPSLREPSYFFPPAHPATPPPVSSPTTPSPASDDPSQQPPAPASPALHTSTDHPRTGSQNLSHLVNTIQRNAGASIAVVWAVIGLAAAIQEPECVPQLGELGAGLVGVVGAGAFICGVVALDEVGEGVGRGGEAAWGVVWRWVKDRVSWGEGDEEAMRMLGEDGESVSMSLQDAASVFPPADTGLRGTTEYGSGGAALRDAHACPAVPDFEATPAPDTRSMTSPSSRREDARASGSSTDSSSQPTSRRPMLQRRADSSTRGLPNNLSPQADNHPSGLLGPSPMPPRRATQPEWKHFTGQGFYKHRQKLDAVSEWLNPGNSRSLEEVMQEIERRDERDQGTEGALAVETEDGTE